MTLVPLRGGHQQYGGLIYAVAGFECAPRSDMQATEAEMQRNWTAAAAFMTEQQVMATGQAFVLLQEGPH